MGGQKSKNLSVSRIHVKMMDIIQHIGYIPGIDDAIYVSTDIGTAQKILSLVRYLLAINGQIFPGIQTGSSTIRYLCRRHFRECVP